VAGALAHAAEEVRTQKLNSDEAELLEATLVRLVNLGETGGATRRAARRDEFDPARRALADKLTTEQYGRLLLAGADTIEICHEQLITQWPWWQNGLSAAAADMRALARLMQRAVEWSSGGRARHYLASGAELGLFTQIAERRLSWLSKTEVAFVSAAKWWARIRRSAEIAAVVALVIASNWAYLAHRDAQRALTAVSQTRNTLVSDLGDEFSKRDLPTELLDRILDRTLQIYDQAIQFDQKNADEYSRGIAYLRKRDYDLAIQNFDRAIQFDPKNAYAYVNRGVAYVNKGDYDRAIQDYDRAIRLNQEDAIVYFNRGIAYANKGDYARAIQDYDQAIRLNSKDASAYANRGAAYGAKGDYDSAIQDYNQAIQLDPNFAFAYHKRGNAYFSKSNYDLAIQDFDQAIQLDPKDGFVYSSRGIVYAVKGDLDRAIQDYDQAIQLDPKAVDNYTNRSIAYVNKGDYDRAIREYDQAIQLAE
jgi:tetratricopeptide (TPR) repeat protein